MEAAVSGWDEDVACSVAVLVSGSFAACSVAVLVPGLSKPAAASNAFADAAVAGVNEARLDELRQHVHIFQHMLRATPGNVPNRR